MPVQNDEDLLCTSGWLHVRGGTFLRQKRRYFRLGAQRISCHSSQTSRALWSFNIFKAIVSSDPEMKKITIQTPQKNVTLFAANNADFKHWLLYIEQTASRIIERRYEFREVLGNGMFGSVFRGHDLVTRERVAIKLIHKQGLAENSRTLPDVSLMRDLKHRNIVSTLGLYETEEVVHIVTEYMPGGSLCSVIQRMGRARAFGESLVKGVICDILYGLVYLHDRGIVHRDMKFGSVLCEKKMLPCRIKIADFGLDGLVSRSLKSRVTSPHFVAPELICGERYGANVDCWSVGVMMYTMLVGSLPFDGTREIEVLDKIVQGKVVVGGVGWESISETGLSFLKGLLERDPRKRFGAREAFQHDWFRDI